MTAHFSDMLRLSRPRLAVIWAPEAIRILQKLAATSPLQVWPTFPALCGKCCRGIPMQNIYNERLWAFIVISKEQEDITFGNIGVICFWRVSFYIRYCFDFAWRLLGGLILTDLYQYFDSFFLEYQNSTMNIFRLAGDVSHLVAIIILFMKIRRSKSCAGMLTVGSFDMQLFTGKSLAVNDLLTCSFIGLKSV